MAKIYLLLGLNYIINTLGPPEALSVLLVLAVSLSFFSAAFGLVAAEVLLDSAAVVVVAPEEATECVVVVVVEGVEELVLGPVELVAILLPPSAPPLPLVMEVAGFCFVCCFAPAGVDAAEVLPRPLPLAPVVVLTPAGLALLLLPPASFAPATGVSFFIFFFFGSPPWVLLASESGSPTEGELLELVLSGAAGAGRFIPPSRVSALATVEDGGEITFDDGLGFWRSVSFVSLDSFPAVVASTFFTSCEEEAAVVCCCGPVIRGCLGAVFCC